jgi:tRNA modification GTPase
LVTELPGTTRDTIEADLDLSGWPVRLADTAGLRQSTDRVEQLGIEVSRKYLAAADLVLLCVELGRPLDPEEQALALRPTTLVVRTKADLRAAEASADDQLAVSAETGDGLGALAGKLVDRLFGDATRIADLEPMLTRERHRVALERAMQALTDAQSEQSLRTSDPVLVAHHVRRAVAALDELIGVVDVDEVLGRVFATFCVGK